MKCEYVWIWERKTEADFYQQQQEQNSIIFAGIANAIVVMIYKVTQLLKVLFVWIHCERASFIILLFDKPVDYFIKVNSEWFAFEGIYYYRSNSRILNITWSYLLSFFLENVSTSILYSFFLTKHRKQVVDFVECA